MPNPPSHDRRATAQNIEPDADSILALAAIPTQYIIKSSPKSSIRYRWRSLHHLVVKLLSPQVFTSFFAIKYVERMRPDKSKSSGKSRLWAFKQRPRSLSCSWENCENEAVHLDSHDNQIGFCILHYEQEED